VSTRDRCRAPIAEFEHGVTQSERPCPPGITESEQIFAMTSSTAADDVERLQLAVLGVT
jgi:hypothetical protein